MDQAGLGDQSQVSVFLGFRVLLACGQITPMQARQPHHCCSKLQCLSMEHAAAVASDQAEKETDTGVYEPGEH